MKKTFLLAIIGIAAILSSCDDSSDDKMARVDFYMTDAPTAADYKAIKIDLQSIRYSTDGEGWVVLPIQPTIVDLLQLTNGQDTLLGNILLKAGVRVQQIRLMLGSNNTLTLSDNTVHTLDVPSGEQSGLKLNVHSEARVTSGYKVIIDFDASRSIVVRGNGTYGLKPVVSAYIEANTSSISGLLTPAATRTRVFTLTSQGDTIATVSDPTRENYFLLRGLASGTYDIQVQDLATEAFYPLKSSVQVVGGSNVDLGTLPLPF